jgi:hypothetical protein
MVDKETLGQSSSKYFSFPCQFSFYQLPHTHYYFYHQRYIFLILRASFNKSKKINWKFSHRSTGFLDFFQHPVFQKIVNTTFRKLHLFPFSGEGEEDTYSLGPLKLALSKGPNWVGAFQTLSIKEWDFKINCTGLSRIYSFRGHKIWFPSSRVAFIEDGSETKEHLRNVVSIVG